MAHLPVPEVLFLRPNPAVGTSNSNSKPSLAVDVVSQPSTASRSVRSVREIMGELRHEGQLANESEVRRILQTDAERSLAIDQHLTDSPRPHFRNSSPPIVESPSDLVQFLVEETVSPRAERSTSESGRSAPIVWPQIVANLVAQNPAQWSAVQAKLAETSRVGILGLERGCGTTTLSSALACSYSQRVELNHTSSLRPLVLIDGNLSRPALAEMLRLANHGSLTEWTTAVSEATLKGNVALDSGLPGNDLVRFWPLSCGIIHSFGNEPESTETSECLDSVRYYLPPQAVGPITQALGRVVSQLASNGNKVVVDLGPIEFWRSLKHLNSIAKMFDQMIVVVPPSPNRRQISQLYWELRDAGQSSCLLLENSVPFQATTKGH